VKPCKSSMPISSRPASQLSLATAKRYSSWAIEKYLTSRSDPAVQTLLVREKPAVAYRRKPPTLRRTGNRYDQNAKIY